MCNLQKVFVKDSRMLPSQPLSVPCQQYVKLWWSSFSKKKKKIVLDLLLVLNFLSILFLEVTYWLENEVIVTPLALGWIELDILACRKWQQTWDFYVLSVVKCYFIVFISFHMHWAGQLYNFLQAFLKGAHLISWEFTFTYNLRTQHGLGWGVDIS